MRFEVSEVNCLPEAFLLGDIWTYAKMYLAELKLQLPVKMLKAPAKVCVLQKSLIHTSKYKSDFLFIILIL